MSVITSIEQWYKNERERIEAKLQKYRTRLEEIEQIYAMINRSTIPVQEPVQEQVPVSENPIKPLTKKDKMALILSKTQNGQNLRVTYWKGKPSIAEGVLQHGTGQIFTVKDSNTNIVYTTLHQWVSAAVSTVRPDMKKSNGDAWEKVEILAQNESWIPMKNLLTVA